MNLDNFKHAGREITHRDDNSFLERTLAGDQFKELILTPCGELFINPGKTIEAEDFWLYFKPDMYMEGALALLHNLVSVRDQDITIYYVYPVRRLFYFYGIV